MPCLSPKAVYRSRFDTHARRAISSVLAASNDDLENTSTAADKILECRSSTLFFFEPEIAIVFITRRMSINRPWAVNELADKLALQESSLIGTNEYRDRIRLCRIMHPERYCSLA